MTRAKRTNILYYLVHFYDLKHFIKSESYLIVGLQRLYISFHSASTLKIHGRRFPGLISIAIKLALRDT